MMKDQDEKSSHRPNPKYYICKWIIDINQIDHIYSLFDLAEKYSIPISFKREVTIDRYFVYEILIKIDTEIRLANFMEEISSKSPFSDWILTTPNEFVPTFSPRVLMDFAHTAWIKMMADDSSQNKAIREKTEKYGILYFASDWVIPFNIAAFQGKNDWLNTFLLIYSRHVKVGIDLRIGNAQKTAGGYFARRFYIRVYTYQEINSITDELREKLDFDQWISVSRDEFLQSEPILTLIPEASLKMEQLRNQIEEMSRLNAQLRRD